MSARCLLDVQMNPKLRILVELTQLFLSRCVGFSSVRLSSLFECRIQEKGVRLLPLEEAKFPFSSLSRK